MEYPCVMKIGSERIMIDLADVITIMERPGGRTCDVYTSLFYDGVTVDHEFDSIITTIQEITNEENDYGTDETCGSDGGAEHCEPSC